MGNPHLKRAWIEWLDDRDSKQGSGSFLTPVLVIETDVDLVPGATGIDSSTLEDVIDEAKALFENRLLTIKNIRIVPAGIYG